MKILPVSTSYYNEGYVMCINVSPVFILTLFSEWSHLGGLFDKFTLDFNKVEQNKNGFLCTRPQAIPILEERVDAFVIYKSLANPKMLLEPGNYEAKILPDFSGVLIKEPAVDIMFTDNILKLEAAEEEYVGGNCDRVFEELRVKIADFNHDDNRKFRFTVIKFPPGMKGTNDYFNKSRGNRKEKKLNLDTNPRFINDNYDDGVPAEKGGIKFDFVSSYVYWKIAIDGTQRSTNEKEGKSLDDLFLEATRGLKRTSIASPLGGGR